MSNPIVEPPWPDFAPAKPTGLLVVLAEFLEGLAPATKGMVSAALRPIPGPAAERKTFEIVIFVTGHTRTSVAMCIVSMPRTTVIVDSGDGSDMSFNGRFSNREKLLIWCRSFARCDETRVIVERMMLHAQRMAEDPDQW